MIFTGATGAAGPTGATGTTGAANTVPLSPNATVSIGTSGGPITLTGGTSAFLTLLRIA